MTDGPVLVSVTIGVLPADVNAGVNAALIVTHLVAGTILMTNTLRSTGRRSSLVIGQTGAGGGIILLLAL